MATDTGDRTNLRRRILFFVSSMQAGGAERVASLLSNHWSELGHEVTLVPTFSGRGDCQYPLHSGVRIEFLADRVRPGGWGFVNRVRRLCALRRMIRDMRPDVVVSFLTHVNVAVLLASLGMAVPVIVSERTFPPAIPADFALGMLRQLLYPRAKAVVMQTEEGRRWLSSTSGGSCGRAIANPVQYPLPRGEPEITPESVLSPTRQVLLAVGRLGEEKQFGQLIRAFASLATANPGWDLVIVGDGAERRRLQEQVASTDLRTRVFLPGHAGNMADWYERAELFALSSRFEGFPNVLLEAMAHGVPAVSFDCSTGPSDIIRHGIDGLLVRPAADFEQFTDALASLMSEPVRRQRFGEAAAEVRERFSIERVARHWDALIFGILQGRP